MIVTLIYDYSPDGTERPVWIVIDGDDQIDMSKKKRLYVDVAQHKKEFVGTFSDDNIGCSVCMNELTSGRKESEFGVDLPSLRHRYGTEFNKVNRLIVLASDVAEILSCSTTI